VISVVACCHCVKLCGAQVNQASNRNKVVLWPGFKGRARRNPHKKYLRSVWFVAKRRECCCNLSAGIALIVRFITNGMCAKSNTQIGLYVARTSNNRVIASGDIYCFLLPQCDGLRACRSRNIRFVIPISRGKCPFCRPLQTPMRSLTILYQVPQTKPAHLMKRRNVFDHC